MNSRLKYGLLACTLGLLALPASAAVVVDKTPDLGTFWGTFDGDPFGTYVYANSFTLISAASIDTIGAYISSNSGVPESLFRYELWADLGGAPDPTAVLAFTDYRSVSSNALVLDTGLLNNTIALTAGIQYWIIASAVGQSSAGSGYSVGGHTQGADGGTFWYSNDPAGQAFDGQGFTSEMAIFASLEAAPTPEPSTFILLALPIAGLAFRRRRSA